MNTTGTYILLVITLICLCVLAVAGWMWGNDDKPEVDLNVSVSPPVPQVIRIADAATTYVNILPVDVKKKIDAGVDFTLIDVRTAEQYSLGHLPGAISIPIVTLPLMLNKLDRNKETIVYCQAGITSIRACVLLVANGFRDVKNMLGGISAWTYEQVRESPTVISL